MISDTEQIKILQEELARLKEENLILLNTMDIQVWYLKDKSTYGSLNKAHAEFFGRTQAEMEHQSIYNFLSEAEANRCSKINEEVFLTKQAIITEEHLTNAQGETRFIQYTKIPKLDDADHVEHVVCYGIDITEREKVEQALLNAKNKAEESDRLKSTFLASVSHELRSPMNGILGFSQLLEIQEELNETSLEYVKHIKKNGDHLLKLIDDVLDLAKIESRKLSITDQHFDLSELCKDVIINLSNGLNSDKRKLVDVEFSAESPESFWLVSDPHRLKQLLNNLLSNAVKFTSKGKVQLSYHVKDKEVEFKVSDTGVGIAESELDNIFNLFYQSRNNKVDLHYGSGLGLAISKGITQILGGKIWVKSVEGKGSDFCFTIPHIAGVLNNQPNTDHSIAHFNIEQLSNKTVLVIERDEPNFLFLKNLLEKFKLKVLRANDGDMARLIVHETKNIDVVILDLGTAVVDGFEVTKYIKNYRKDLPIIVVSEFDVDGLKTKAIQRGASYCLDLPININKLLTALLNCIDPDNA